MLSYRFPASLGACRPPVPTLKNSLRSNGGKPFGTAGVVCSLNGRSNTRKTFSNLLIYRHLSRLSGAMVARLTPDQKVACSNHVRVVSTFHMLNQNINNI